MKISTFVPRKGFENLDENVSLLGLGRPVTAETEAEAAVNAVAWFKAEFPDYLFDFAYLTAYPEYSNEDGVVGWEFDVEADEKTSLPVVLPSKCDGCSCSC